MPAAFSSAIRMQSHKNHGHRSRNVWNGREQANTKITCFRNIVDQIRQPQTQTIGASSRAEINNNEKPHFPACERAKNFTRSTPGMGLPLTAQSVNQTRALFCLQPSGSSRTVCEKQHYENPKQHGP